MRLLYHTLSYRFFPIQTSNTGDSFLGHQPLGLTLAMHILAFTSELAVGEAWLGRVIWMPMQIRLGDCSVSSLLPSTVVIFPSSGGWDSGAARPVSFVRAGPGVFGSQTSVLLEAYYSGLTAKVITTRMFLVYGKVRKD